jgi:hypothetical protein
MSKVEFIVLRDGQEYKRIKGDGAVITINSGGLFGNFSGNDLCSIACCLELMKRRIINNLSKDNKMTRAEIDKLISETLEGAKYYEDWKQG